MTHTYSAKPVALLTRKRWNNRKINKSINYFVGGKKLPGVVGVDFLPSGTMRYIYQNKLKQNNILNLKAEIRAEERKGCRSAVTMLLNIQYTFGQNKRGPRCNVWGYLMKLQVQIWSLKSLEGISVHLTYVQLPLWYVGVSFLRHLCCH